MCGCGGGADAKERLGGWLNLVQKFTKFSLNF